MLGARGPMLEVVADASFLTSPVSCEVSNAVGSANCSTALDVQCEPRRGRGCGQRGTRGNGPGVRARRDRDGLWKEVGQAWGVGRVWLCWVSVTVERGQSEGGSRAFDPSCGQGAYTWALEGAVSEWLIPGQMLQPPQSCDFLCLSRAYSAGKTGALVCRRRGRRLLQLCLAREPAPTGNLDPPWGRAGKAGYGASGHGREWTELPPKALPLTPLHIPGAGLWAHAASSVGGAGGFRRLRVQG